MTAEIDNLDIWDGYALGTNGGGIYNSGTLTLKNDSFEFDHAVFNNVGAGGSGGAIFNGSGATLNISNCAIAQGGASDLGGAVYNSGTLVCSLTTLYTNNAKFGGGIANISKILGVKATTELKEASQIYSNGASDAGGGIYESGGSVTMAGIGGGSKDIYKNEANNGGGIFVVSGTLTLKFDVSVNGNQASSSGGGIYNAGGNVSISGGTILNNTATSSGGGIFSSGGTLTLAGGEEIGSGNSAIDGGGMYLTANSTTTFTSVTVSGNKATGQGKGIAYEKGATLKNLAGLKDPDDNGNPVQV